MVRWLFLFSLCWCQNALAQQSLVVANSHSWAPLSFADNEGEPRGLLIEFWGLFSEYSGKNVRFDLKNWGESIEMVKNGHADIHAGLLRSPKREKFLLFSESLFPLVTGVFKRLEVSGKGMPVGVVKGSYEAEYIAEKHSDWSISVFENNRNMILAAANKKVAGFVADYPTGAYFIKEMQLIDEVAFSEFLYSKPIHAAVSSDNQALISLINSGVSKIPKRELDALLIKWEILPESNKNNPFTIMWWVILVFALFFAGWGVLVIKR